MERILRFFFFETENYIVLLRTAWLLQVTEAAFYRPLDYSLTVSQPKGQGKTTKSKFPIP